MSLSQPVSLSLYILSPVQLRRGVIEQLWWVPGIQPGSTHHSNELITCCGDAKLLAMDRKACSIEQRFLSSCRKKTPFLITSESPLICVHHEVKQQKHWTEGDLQYLTCSFRKYVSLSPLSLATVFSCHFAKCLFLSSQESWLLGPM